MKLQEIVPSIEETLGKEFLVIGRNSLAYKYANGERTDEVEGVKMDCFTQKIWSRISVKVKTPPAFDFEGEPIRVVFENLRGKVYLTQGDYKLSLTADSVSRVEKISPARIKVTKEE